MPSLAEEPPVKKRSSRKAQPDGWWGSGEAPHRRWPGVTIDIPSVWRGNRWESPGGAYYFDQEAADFAAGFFPTCLQHHIGAFNGHPFDLMAYQSVIVRALFGWKKSNGLRRFQKVFLAVPKGSGKALALDTPIPTPNGWTTMGAIHVGDVVLSESGRPVSVLAATEVMYGRDCYRVTFDDGAEIIADADHLWFTHHRRPERRPCEGSIKTTAEIASTLRYSNGQYQSANHSVPLAQALDLPEIDLPVEPYTLGVWLGDGDSDCARVTAGAQDREELCGHLLAVGTSVGHAKRTNAAARVTIGSSARGRGMHGGDSLKAKLRRINVLNDKHVPEAYLRASLSQRLSLLQGLMDTDGSISGTSGACEFSVTNERLARGVHELILSLGIKATVVDHAAKIYGREVSRRWRIGFHPPIGMPVFRLDRKATRQVERHQRRRLSGERRIVSCDRVASVPVRCIGVDGPSHMYLAGREMVPTHNSPFGAGLGIFGAFFDGESGSEVYAVAADRKQAGIVFDSAKVMVQRNPAWEDRFEVFRDSIKLSGGTEYFQVLSSDASTKHGFRPHFIIFDEFHAQPNRDLFDTLYRGMGKRRQPVLVMITTAGDDDESICFEEWAYARRVITGEVKDDSYLPVIFEARADEDWSDEAVQRRVNPGYGITMQAEYFRSETAAAMAEPRKRNSFIQLHLNRWVNQATAWIPVEWWDACSASMPPDSELAALPCAAGLDLAQKIDLACLSVVFRQRTASVLPVSIVGTEGSDPWLEGNPGYRPQEVVKRTIDLNYRIVIVPFFWIPEETMRQREREDGVPYSQWVNAGLVTPTEGAIIDYSRIYADITTKIAPRFPRLKQSTIGYDPAFATDLATNLRDRAGQPVAEVLQNYTHLSEVCHIFEALVKAKMVTHGGNRTLRNHVEHVAIKRDDAGRLRPVKPKRAGKHIDGVVASLMGLKMLATVPEHIGPQLFFLGGKT